MVCRLAHNYFPSFPIIKNPKHHHNMTRLPALRIENLDSRSSSLIRTALPTTGFPKFQLEELSKAPHVPKSIADLVLQTLVAPPAAIPPPLPPSVEEAYRKKCIELKRRKTEVEESNDVFRVRKARINRSITKLRLERAYLLEGLAKRMKKTGGTIDGIFDEDSEGSSEGPPTVWVSKLNTLVPLLEGIDF